MKTPLSERILTTAVILLSVLLSDHAYPYPKSHGPFSEGEAPFQFPLRRCVLLNQAEVDKTDGCCTWIFAPPVSNPARYLHLEMRDEPFGCFVAVLDGSRRVLMQSRQVSEFRLGVCAYTADLNGDRTDDFVISTWSGGCGLGACNYDRAFVLSEARGYRVSAIPSMCPGPEDFVILRQRGQCHVINTHFVYGGNEKTKDGRPHNFWVYNLLRIEGSRLLLADRDDSRFPKWVWYTDKDNHAETTQLTTEQKRRAWSPKIEDLFLKPSHTSGATQPAGNGGR